LLDFVGSDLRTLSLALARFATILLCVPFSCQEVQREAKMFDLLLSLKVETPASQAEIRITFIPFELEVSLPFSIPFELPLPLVFPISLPLQITKSTAFTQSPLLAPQHYLSGLVESRSISSFLYRVKEEGTIEFTPA
jgi:hypothetical protein